MTPARDTEAGSALAMALLVTIMLFGIATSYVTLSFGSFESSNREMATVEARIAAEDGIQLSIAEMKSGVDSGGDGLGNLTMTEVDGRTIKTQVTNLGGNVYAIHSVATLRRARSAADVVMELVPT